MYCQDPESWMNCQALQEIKKIYGHYYENPLYVYKVCLDRYIVIMKKLPDTLTNEHRYNVVDPRYAKFRANKLEVCVIFDVHDPSQTQEHIINHYNEIQIKYEVNSVATPNEFDIKLENVCSCGIHYFNNMCTVFYYTRRPINYTGYWIAWYDNGQKYWEGNYLDGKRNGIQIIFYTNGHKKTRGNYQDDKKTGNWIEWHDNGQKKLEGNYRDDNRTGIWVEWSCDGKNMANSWYGNDKYLGNERTLEVIDQGPEAPGTLDQGSGALGTLVSGTALEQTDQRPGAPGTLVSGTAPEAIDQGPDAPEPPVIGAGAFETIVSIRNLGSRDGRSRACRLL
jgi:hypothetical protein